MAKFLKYTITSIVAAAIIFAVAAYRGAFASGDAQVLLMAWCDGCFVAAVAIGGVGLLSFVASDGFFDMISFGMRKFFMLLQRDDEKLKESFVDYKRKKLAKARASYGFLLVIASICLVMAFVLLYFYMNI